MRNICLTTSSDEGENMEYLFTSSKAFSKSKTNLAKSSHPATELVVGLIVNNNEHLVRALADTGANSSSSILDAYTSAMCPFIKTGDTFITTKTGICL
jgi:myo-inositol-hexaphosphate 3-phosphohydrolase